MLEPFNWVSMTAYLKLMSDTKDLTIEQCQPKVVRGKYASGWHKAAIRLMVDENIEAAGSVPFTYNVNEKVGIGGYKFWIITEVKLHDEKAPWAIRLQNLCLWSLVPVELIESNRIDFRTRPQFWIDIADKAFCNIFGQSPAAW